MFTNLVRRFLRMPEGSGTRAAFPVDTGELNNTVPVPDSTTRLISIATAGCW